MTDVAGPAQGAHDLVTAAGPVQPPRWWQRSRIALGLSPTPRPGLMLLPLGMALGPAGLNLLSPAVLNHLDPAVSVALTAIGAFVGLGLDVRRPREIRLFTAASFESGLTMACVAAGTAALVVNGAADGPLRLALLLGICAAASATLADEPPGEAASPVGRIGDLDDVLPIVAGGLALAWLRVGLSSAALPLVGQTALIALLMALAGWLLVAQTTDRAEQHVFMAGTLLLLGGAAAYLSMSALLVGLVGGAAWQVAGGAARERFTSHLQYLERPLIVLLLVVAGARFALSPSTLAFVAVYVLCRAAGKIVGGWIAVRVAGRDLPRGLGRHLISPGVIAIAFAVNVLQADTTGGIGERLLGIVVLGSLGSELLSILAAPRRSAS